jgi:hypothetical protein
MSEKFGKFNHLVQRIEMLTEQVVKKPHDQKLKRALKKAEDGLYNMIEKEQKEIDRMLENLNFNEDEQWEE